MNLWLACSGLWKALERETDGEPNQLPDLGKIRTAAHRLIHSVNDLSGGGRSDNSNNNGRRKEWLRPGCARRRRP